MPKIFKNGQLVNVSEEEAASLQQQAVEQAMPGTPITPLGASGEGATPDQAKMYGTKAQKDNALRMETTQEETLSGQDRQRQPRQEASMSEEAALRKAANIKQLGSLESRVDSIIEERFTGAQKEAASGLAIQEDQLAELEPEVKTAVTTNLAAYQKAVDNFSKGTGSQEEVNAALVALNQSLDNALTTASGVAETYLKSVKDTVGTDIAKQIEDTLTLEDVGVESFGLSEQDLTDLLGPQWSTMSIPQVREAIASIRRDEFSLVDQARRELADPGTSPARKQEILKQLRDAGQVGVAGAEVQVANIEQAIEDADTIEFAGKSYTIEELLDDQNISDTITRYLALPEGSEARKVYEEQFGGGFTDWIKEHEEALTDLVGGIEETNKVFDKLQEDNKEASLVTELGNQEIPEDLMSSLFPDIGKWTATNYKEALESMPWYAVLTDDKSISKGNKIAFLDAMKNVPIDPELAQEIKSLNSEEARALMRNPKQYKDYLWYRAQYTKDPDTFTKEQLQDPDFLLDYLYGADVKTDTIKEAAERDRIASLVSKDKGATSRYSSYKKLLDSQGNLDPDKIVAYIKSNKPKRDLETNELLTDPSSIKDFLANGKPSTHFKEYRKATPTKAYSESMFNSIYAYLKGEKTPEIDGKDMQDLFRKNPDIVNISKDDGIYNTLSDEAKSQLSTKVTLTANKESNKLMQGAKQSIEAGLATIPIAQIKPTYEGMRELNVAVDKGYAVINEWKKQLKRLENLRDKSSGMLRDAYDRQIKAQRSSINKAIKPWNDKIQSVRDQYNAFLRERMNEIGMANIPIEEEPYYAPKLLNF